MAEYFCYLACSEDSWFMNESQLIVACSALCLSRYVLGVSPCFPNKWRMKAKLSPSDILPCIRGLFGIVTSENKKEIQELFCQEKVKCIFSSV